MIQFKNISKTYTLKGQHFNALKNINLEIPEGSIFGIIGYSGAGKSTLIRLINLLERPTTGQVFIGDQDFCSLNAADLRRERSNIGMIFQHFNLLNSKTVAANIAMPLQLLGQPKAKIAARVEELLDYVGLSDKKNAYPDELSGGQKQRVGIARALANHPKILLCDEATSALDPQTTRSVLELLKKINREQNISIVMVTHEMDVIESVCDFVAVMQAGEVVEVGPTLEIFSQPQHATTKTFIQTVLEQQLPTNILERLENQNHQSIFCLQFLGTSAQETVVQQVILKFDIHFNILFANMKEIQGKVIGQMFVQILGDTENISAAIRYFEQQQVRVIQNGVVA